LLTDINNNFLIHNKMSSFFDTFSTNKIIKKA